MSLKQGLQTQGCAQLAFLGRTLQCLLICHCKISSLELKYYHLLPFQALVINTFTTLNELNTGTEFMQTRKQTVLFCEAVILNTNCSLTGVTLSAGNFFAGKTSAATGQVRNTLQLFNICKSGAINACSCKSIHILLTSSYISHDPLSHKVRKEIFWPSKFDRTISAYADIVSEHRGN